MTADERRRWRLKVFLGAAAGVVKTYAGPVANDVVPVTFTQPIAATDPLRTGAYSKTLTFTLSTTSP